MAQSKLGWIGCGNMGKPMAMHLIKAGHQVFVYDVVRQNTDELVESGAVWCESPRAVSEQADYIFTSVPNGKILKIVNLDPNGIVSGLTAGKTVIDTSTVSPAESRSVAAAIGEAGCSFLRSPVTGSTVLAQNSALGVFCSGPPDAYKKVLPFFRTFSNKQYYLGEGEQSRILKLAINLMIAVNMQMLAEAMILVEKENLDRAQALEIISNSAAGAPVIQYKVDNVLNRDYTAAFSVEMMEKDLDLVLSAAREYNVGLPVTALTRQFLAMANSTGRAKDDFSVLVELLEEISHLG